MQPFSDMNSHSIWPCRFHARMSVTFPLLHLYTPLQGPSLMSPIPGPHTKTAPIHIFLARAHNKRATWTAIKAPPGSTSWSKKGFYLFSDHFCQTWGFHGWRFQPLARQHLSEKFRDLFTLSPFKWCTKGWLLWNKTQGSYICSLKP